ncbi:MAG: hypothetical protein ACK4PI_13875 [Tepidisphaerales bacterium]
MVNGWGEWRGLKGPSAATVTVALLVCGGCQAPRGPLVVGSPDPAVNVPAMVEAAQKRRTADAARLVEQLESPDPAVRLFAIRTLAELYDGQTLGYRHYDPPAVRREAVARWRSKLGLVEAKEATP